MAFSGGVYSRVYSWVTDKNNSVNITASRMDTEDNGFATGLSSCLLKDGTQIVTANIPMATFKFTGLGSGTASTDSANIGQIQNQKFNWVAGGGTADAITATYSPAVTALVDGMELDFRASAANTTTTPTFAPNGLTAHTITMLGGGALVAGNIAAALAECKLRYNLANTRWELLNPAVISAGATLLAAITASSLTSFGASIALGTPASGVLTNATGTATGLTSGITNALKSATTTVNVSSATAPSAGQGLIATSGTAAVWAGPTVYQATPSDPTGTSNTTGLMMGLAGAFTPATTGTILIVISGAVTNGTASDGAKYQIRYGTSTAPTNGAALTGTAVGALQNMTPGNNTFLQPFSVNAIVTGLTPTTAYWIDLSLAAVTGGTASMKTISISVYELK